MDSILSILHVIGILFLVLIVFNVMIIVHEWGHFLAARWRGLHIEKFQIWFGKPLWKKTYNGVQYGLGCIPAGGFVALPQMAPMEMIEGGNSPREKLKTITPLDKIIVAFAGPLFSFLLACFFAVIVWQIGTPVDENDKSLVIGHISSDGPAAASDLEVGDEIQEIDGAPIKRFHGMVDSVQWAVVSGTSDDIDFKIKKADGEVRNVIVKAPHAELDVEWDKLSWWSKIWTRPPLRRIGIDSQLTPLVGPVLENSPAAEAGLETHDFIVSVDGQRLLNPAGLSEYINANPNKELLIGVERDGKPMEFKATPRVPDEHPDGRDKPILGITWNLAGKRKLDNPSPTEQVTNSLRMMKNTIAAVFSPKSKIGASHLSGPVGIVNLYYNLFKADDGWRLVLWFSVVLNINLAVMNMLPFPVLDGGHITMALIESIRRRPLNTRLLEVIQGSAVILLLSFMVFVTLKDTGGIFGVGSGGGSGNNGSGKATKFHPR